MARFISILFILLLPVSVLYGQNLTEFGHLNPELNLIKECNEIPVLVIAKSRFDPKSKGILILNTKTNNEIVFDNKINGNIQDFFWDPRTCNNYLMISAIQSVAGWYQLHYDIEEGLSIGERILGIPSTSRTLPNVELNSSYVLKTIYSFDPYKKENNSEAFKIYDVSSNEVLWELINNGIDPMQVSNIYWLFDTWIFITGSRYLGFKKIYSEYIMENNSKILNFLEKEVKDFSPEIIIGYGEDCIITTSIDLIGLTLRSTDGLIFYQDKDFNLLSFLDTSDTEAVIPILYFDGTKIYYEVHVSHNSMFLPFSTVILKLDEGIAYRTTNGFSTLLGIYCNAD